MSRFEWVVVLLLIVIFVSTQMGCATTQGSGAGLTAASRPVEQICFLRQEGRQDSGIQGALQEQVGAEPQRGQPHQWKRVALRVAPGEWVKERVILRPGDGYVSD